MIYVLQNNYKKEMKKYYWLNEIESDWSFDEDNKDSLNIWVSKALCLSGIGVYRETSSRNFKIKLKILTTENSQVLV